MFSIVPEVLSLLFHLLEEVADWFYYRNDWDRRWSPLSYLFMLISAAAVVVLLVSVGQVIWRAVGGSSP